MVNENMEKLRAKWRRNMLISNATFLITVGIFGVAYAAHIIFCLITKQLLLLIIGLIVFPIGIIHGILVILGIG